MPQEDAEEPPVIPLETEEQTGQDHCPEEVVMTEDSVECDDMLIDTKADVSEAASLSIQELKNRLKAAGQPTSGKKETLLRRYETTLS